MAEKEMASKRGSGTAKPGRFCDEDCNHCCLPENRHFTLLANTMVEMFGFDKVYPVVQAICQNMTCCADCRIDDFCHVDGCEIVDEADRIAAAVKAVRKRMTRSRRLEDDGERRCGMTPYDQMREALRLCGAQMCMFCQQKELAKSMLKKRPLEVYCHPEECEEFRVLKAALALPRRNCDVYTTLEDACMAWRDTSPVDKDGVIVMTFDEWLFATAKEGEGNGR